MTFSAAASMSYSTRLNQKRFETLSKMVKLARLS